MCSMAMATEAMGANAAAVGSVPEAVFRSRLGVFEANSNVLRAVWNACANVGCLLPEQGHVCVDYVAGEVVVHRLDFGT